MKKVALIFLLVILPLVCLAETVTLKSGKTVEGRIIDKTDKYLKMDFQGVLLTFFLDEIQAINGEKVSLLSTSDNEQKQSPTINTHYVENIDEAMLENYRNIAEKYKYDGSNEIVLNQGIIFKAHDIAIKDGCIFIMFKGDKRAEKEYETGLVIPLTEVKSINSNPVNQADANCALGNFYLNKPGGLNKAIEFYEKTIAIDPQHRMALANITAAYNYVGRFDDTIYIGQKALEVYPESEIIYFNLGVAYAMKNNFSQAIESYQKAISLNPNCKQALVNLGVLYFNLGNYEEAKKNLTAAKNLLSKTEKTEVMFEDLTMISEAIEQYLGRIDDEIDYREGLEYALAQNFDEARGYFQRILDRDKTSFQARCSLKLIDGVNKKEVNKEYAYYFFRGLSYHRKKEYELAINEFEKALKIDTIYPAAYLFLGIEFISLKQEEKAVPFFEKVIEREADNAEAFWGLGSAYEALGNYALAKDNLEKAKRLFEQKENDNAVKGIEEQLKKLYDK